MAEPGGAGLVRWSNAAQQAAGHALLLAVGVVLAGWLLTAGSATAQSEAKAVPVRVQAIVMLDTVNIPRQFPGQLEAGQTSDLAFEFGGHLVEVLVDEGDTISVGDVLARLDTDALMAERSELLASRDAVRAQLAYAQTSLERAERLQNSGTSSADRVDQAVANRNELTAREAEIEAGLQQADIRMEKAQLIAPFDGVVGQRHLDGGNFVAAGQSVLTLYQARDSRFRVGLPPDLDPSALMGAEVAFDGQPYPATLRRVRPDLDPATQMRVALFDVSGDTPRSFGETGVLLASVPLRLTGAWVPLDAMQPGPDDTWTIFVVDDRNIAHSVLVEVLHIGTDRAVVFGAFDDGDRMIVGGAHKLSGGQLVDPV